MVHSLIDDLFQDLDAELRRLGLKKTDLKLTGQRPIILDTINNDVDRVSFGLDRFWFEEEIEGVESDRYSPDYIQIHGHRKLLTAS